MLQEGTLSSSSYGIFLYCISMNFNLQYLCNIGPKKIINHVCFDIFRIESSQGNLEYMLS